MDIYISCGLGDCLIYCQIYDLYRDTFKYNYILDYKLIYKYRNEKYEIFVKKIFKLFNVPLKILFNDNYDESQKFQWTQLLKEYPITNNTLIKYVPIIPNDLPNSYIVINLNIRYVTGYMNKNTFDNMINNICYILNNTTFIYPPVIIGHRNSSVKFEVTNYSFYDKLDISKFIDKSTNCNLIFEPDFDNLLYDINILKNSKETFQFGFGGSLCLNTFFSNKLSAIISNDKDINYDILPLEFFSYFFDNSLNTTIYKNYIDLLKRLIIYKK